MIIDDHSIFYWISHCNSGFWPATFGSQVSIFRPLTLQTLAAGVLWSAYASGAVAKQQKWSCCYSSMQETNYTSHFVVLKFPPAVSFVWHLKLWPAQYVWNLMESLLTRNSSSETYDNDSLCWNAEFICTWTIHVSNQRFRGQCRAGNTQYVLNCCKWKEVCRCLCYLVAYPPCGVLFLEESRMEW